jgi:glycosyltransferase involved in cell wall biosynthesis
VAAADRDAGALTVLDRLKRTAYRSAVGAAALAALPFRQRRAIAVSYGGARAGDAGGPLVKRRILGARFPEQRFGYSLLYILSNAIYLPQSVIDAVHRARVPIVLNQNGVFYPSWYPDGWERENARMAAVHRVASHVLYQSAFCRSCAERYLGRRDGPSEILYNAVDVAHFTPAEPGERPFTFLVTGKIGSSTAYRLISSIEGLAAARRGGLDVRLTVAGVVEPEIEAQARALAGGHGIADHVDFTGPYDGAGAPQVYRAADAYLMTKHNDPCPNVVLEALASGLPVLYSRSGGVPELVGDEAGVPLSVPETFDDTPTPAPAAIAAGMARIIAGREDMSRAARTRAVERFGLTAWLDRHERIFRDLLERAGK